MTGMTSDTGWEAVGHMGRATGSLVPASDAHSGAGAHNTKTERPRSGPDAANIRYGAGPTPNPLRTNEGADMAKRTRTPGRSDSQTRISAVNITLASSTVAVPAIPSLA